MVIKERIKPFFLIMLGELYEEIIVEELAIYGREDNLVDKFIFKFMKERPDSGQSIRIETHNRERENIYLLFI